MVEKRNAAGYIADAVVILLLTAIAICCLAPLWHCLMASISDGQSLLAHEGISLMPIGKATLDGYKYVFRDNRILQGYANTLLYVVGRVGIGFLLNVLGGYAISKKGKLSPFLTLFMVFTMMFNGGTVPTYMVVRNLGMTGHRLSLILPSCTNAMFVMLAVRGFNSVPQATVESARLDGAGDLTVLFRILLPQSMGLISVSLINTGLLAWNAWFEASIYVTMQQDLWPLQLWIRQISAESKDFLNYANPDYSRYLIQYVVIVIATLPILIVFPFFQKTLEKGMMQGAVKE